MDVKQKTAITPKDLNFKKRKPVFLVIRKIEKGSYVAACYLFSSQMTRMDCLGNGEQHKI